MPSRRGRRKKEINKTKINIGALIIRMGFGVYYTITRRRNPQKPILIIKAPTLGSSSNLGRPSSQSDSRLETPSPPRVGVLNQLHNQS